MDGRFTFCSIEAEKAELFRQTVAKTVAISEKEKKLNS